MNLWTDSERKWALEPESKPKIEETHLLHNVMFKLSYLKLHFTLKLTTLLLWTKYSILLK